ncbi:MAG: hypothetical protein KAU90_06500 [Sulfurovaceae bacterium]|nr:hypothetical protein [Sulfurovaceae bacterium]
MQLTINIPNEELFDKNEGLESIDNNREKYHQSELSKDEVLENENQGLNSDMFVSSLSDKLHMNFVSSKEEKL